MKYHPPLKEAILVKRYKRFLADIRVGNKLLTIHCPNTGAMTNCAEPLSTIWYSTSDNPKRKYPGTFELIKTADCDLAGVNTGKANHLVKEAIQSGIVDELKGYPTLKSEVKFGSENSRVDFLLTENIQDERHCYVEVKSVTLATGNGLGLFPDAISSRGSKHLRELIKVREEGNRAVLFFCVQHTGIDRVEPAANIDPLYSETLKEASDLGVEIIAYKAAISPEEIRLSHAIPVLIK